MAVHQHGPQCLELWQGSSLLGSYESSYSNTPAGSLRENPTLYTIAMRKRGSRVRVYCGANNTLRFTANISSQGSGRCGYQSDCPIM
ncbi:MAG: hypothetical protein FWG10_02550 [Eubacteriaceae bacterium]|nr:hypothetical protein [Eubacteriaceae bacterium]